LLWRQPLRDERPQKQRRYQRSFENNRNQKRFLANQSCSVQRLLVAIYEAL
jgi:hypothetical protein